MTRCRAGLLARLRSDDDGFSLLEAVAAAVVLAILSVGVAGLLLTSMRTSQLDRQRVAASSLAAREMEIVRNTFATSDASALTIVNAAQVTNPDSLSGLALPSVVNGVPYTVVRSAEWSTNGTGQGACNGGSQVSYPSARVTVTVTWPGMGAVAPVTTESLLTPSKHLLVDNSVGFVAVKVLRYNQQPYAGRTVNAALGGKQESQGTDGFGCAVFGIAPGTWTFTMNEAGFVDYSDNATATHQVVVAGASFTQFTFTYDQSVTLNVSYTTTAGYPVPSPLPSITIANPNMPVSPYFGGQTSNTFPATAGTTTLSNLGPYAGGYSVYAGGCSDANPAGPPTGGSSTSVPVSPGGTFAATASLAPVDITVVNGSNVAQPNTPVTATHNGGTCTSGQGTLSLGITNATGKLSVSMPYGSWTLSTNRGGSTVFAPAASGPTAVRVTTS